MTPDALVFFFAAVAVVEAVLLALSYARARRAAVEARRAADDAQGTLREKLTSAEHERDRVLTVFSSMEEGVLVVDSDHRILVANRSFARAFGVPEPGLAGRRSWEVIRDAALNEWISEALRGRRAAQMEHALTLSTRTFQVHVSPVFAGSDFLGAAVVFHDLTRVKALERVRTEFVANVSHELKTPLASILGSLETLKDGAADDPAARREFLDVVQDHARRLARIVDQLLKLSEAEAAGPCVTEPVDAAKIARRVTEEFASVAADHGVTLELDAPSAGFAVRADENGLERALSNLVDNAIKYNRRGGRISVEFARGDDGARIRVSDDGIGIPEADLARVFERFYRVDKSRSRDSGGSGLGLSIARHLVERQGGRVEVSSRPGRGSTFSIVLPAA